MPHLLSIQDLSTETISALLAHATQLEIESKHHDVPWVMASCFFEASTRTRLSFESAAVQMNGRVIGVSDPTKSSVSKGESLSDTLRVLGNYADVLVLRHPMLGAAQVAAGSVSIPVVNAGDGSGEHPTQTLIDLYSMLKTQGSLQGLTVAIVGDLFNARTVHSLVLAAAHFEIKLLLIAPPELQLPQPLCIAITEAGGAYEKIESISEALALADIVYLTRLQTERYPDNADAVSDAFLRCCTITPRQLSYAKPNMRLLHPLPRLQELPTAIDSSPHAYYFQQAAHAVPVRKAILRYVLGKDIG